MDRIALETLRAEMLEDCRVALEAERTAVERMQIGGVPALEGCAHHICRMYNALEQMLLRIAKAFENNIDDDQGWRTALLSRLATAIPGVRPALLPPDLKSPLRELRAFRHVFVHAYELELDRDKLVLVLKYARQVAVQLPAVAERFIAQVALEQQIDLR